MYVVSAIIVVLTILNYMFSIILYKEPDDNEYFSNVRQISVVNNRYLFPEPRYALFASIMSGLMIGIYLALANYYGVISSIKWSVAFLIFLCYLVEMSRKITLDEDTLTSSKLFLFKKKIPINKIEGMYVYSYNKKWLKQHALTTKLVIAESEGKKDKIILSSFSNKKVFAMMKDNFNIVDHKLFVQKNDDKVE